MKLVLGTRASDLARAQSAGIAQALREAGHQVEVQLVLTAGDANQREGFQAIGAPGVFVRELESALLEGQVDLAVHSYKDLPSSSPPGLLIAAVPPRALPSDLLFTRARAVAADPDLPLVQGARVGTASARRKALLEALRPDLEVQLLRGNVPTRLAKLQAGEHDAILLAAAGVLRLEAAARAGDEDVQALPIEGLVRTELDPEVFVPAPSQGALALQVRSGDEQTHAAVAELDDPPTRRTVSAERALLALVQGGCELPFGAWCRADASDELVLDCVLGGEGRLRRARSRGGLPEELALEAWEELRAQELESGS